MKTRLLLYFRDIKRFPIVATEWKDMDVVVCDLKFKHEIEVKISISDLKADFKKFKFMYFGEEFYQEHRDFVPNNFYYAIPDELKEKAIPIIEENAPFAGIIVVKPLEIKGRNSDDFVKIVKQPDWIHKKEIRPEGVKSLISRVCGEIIYFRKKALERTV